MNRKNRTTNCWTYGKTKKRYRPAPYFLASDAVCRSVNMWLLLFGHGKSVAMQPKM